jgi:hypothetical protein
MSSATKPTTVATPWGRAIVVEQAAISQEGDGRAFGSLVQLLELTNGGKRLVRLAYTTDGVARRGPVTLRLEDLDALRAELAPLPGLTAALSRATTVPARGGLGIGGPGAEAGRCDNGRGDQARLGFLRRR